jgi:hypothetical protein
MATLRVWEKLTGRTGAGGTPTPVKIVTGMPRLAQSPVLRVQVYGNHAENGIAKRERSTSPYLAG